MAILRLVFEDGDVRANAGAQVDASILADPEEVGRVAQRLLPALNVFVELERERLEKKA